MVALVGPVMAPKVETLRPLDTNWNVPVAFPIIVLSPPDALIDAAPVAIKPLDAVRSPFKNTLSPGVAVLIVAVVLSLLKYPTVPFAPPIILPSQIRLPSAFTTVQPVSFDPPAKLTFPAEPLAIFTSPVVPVLIVRSVAAVFTEIVGAEPVKVKCVLSTLILSKEETLDTAPLLMTILLIVLPL